MHFDQCVRQLLDKALQKLQNMLKNSVEASHINQN